MLGRIGSCDMIGLTAGFDRHIRDCGGEPGAGDYREIGRQVGELSRRLCPGGVCALLEGGYDPEAVGEGSLALMRGLEEMYGSAK